MEDLARDISRGIEQFCRCEFQSNYITDEQLACDEKFPDVVMFTGRIISTSDRSSSDLVLDLEKWISSKPIAVVQGEQLQVVSDSQTPPSITTEEEEDSSLSVPMVGTITAVAVILLVAIIVTISAVVYYR